MSTVMPWVAALLTIVGLSVAAARAKMEFGGAVALAIAAVGLGFALWTPYDLKADEVGYSITLITWAVSLIFVIGAPLAVPRPQEVNTGSLS